MRDLADGEPEQGSGGLLIEELRVRRAAHEPLAAHVVKVVTAEVNGLGLVAGDVDLHMRDAVLTDCDLSNVQARKAHLRRVEWRGCRLVGLGLIESELESVKFSDGTLMLGSFGHSRLHRVVFEGVNLSEASFVGADLTQVVFDGCVLAGADFRDARLSACEIRGTSLDGVLGIGSLKGVTMPAADVVASAAALAGALGISVDSER